LDLSRGTNPPRHIVISQRSSIIGHRQQHRCCDATPLLQRGQDIKLQRTMPHQTTRRTSSLWVACHRTRHNTITDRTAFIGLFVWTSTHPKLGLGHAGPSTWVVWHSSIKKTARDLHIKVRSSPWSESRHIIIFGHQRSDASAAVGLGHLSSLWRYQRHRLHHATQPRSPSNLFTLFNKNCGRLQRAMTHCNTWQPIRQELGSFISRLSSASSRLRSAFL
jgi:hypothetical protein